MDEETIGAQAYAAIASQLEEWGGTVDDLDDGMEAMDGDDGDWDDIEMESAAPSKQKTTSTRFPITTVADAHENDATSERNQMWDEEDECSETSVMQEEDDEDPQMGDAAMVPHEYQDGEEEEEDDDRIPMVPIRGDGRDTRYHDALLSFLRTTRQMYHQLDLLQQERSLLSLGKERSDALAKQEDTIETALAEAQVHLLDSYASLNFDSSAVSQTEGNMWTLLATLRSLGLPFMLYDDSPSHQAQERERLRQRVASMARQSIHKSPADVWEEVLAWPELQRRERLLEWAQDCCARQLSSVIIPSKKGDTTTMWPATLRQFKHHGTDNNSRSDNKVSSMDPDAPLLLCLQSSRQGKMQSSSPLYGTDDENDAQLLDACLKLILAGRLDQALELCREAGQPWRAASFGGGIPHGTAKGDDGVAVAVGNPSRSLWKRRSWQLARVLRDTAASSHDASCSAHVESAIYALLSDDLETALAAPPLRTWEKSLVAHFSASMGRFQDDVWHAHNNARRGTRKRFPFQGTQHVTAEVDQLKCTSQLSVLHEQDMVDALARSPYDAVAGPASRILEQTMASVVTGTAALSQFLWNACSDLSAHNETEHRFLLHLVLCLDSMAPDFMATTLLEQQHTTGVESEAETGTNTKPYDTTTDWMKNALLLHHLERFLIPRADLWHTVALYASLLPTATTLQVCTDFWVSVQDNRMRQMVLRGARRHFTPGLDSIVLRRVVRTIFAAEPISTTRTKLVVPQKSRRAGWLPQDLLTKSEMRMMKAVDWLCYHPEHAGDALICTNMLVRKFMLATEEHTNHQPVGPSKQHALRIFLENYLPDETISNARNLIVQDEEGEGDNVPQEKCGDVSIHQVQDADVEYTALSAYLQAMAAYDTWKDALQKSSATSGPKKSKSAVTTTMSSLHTEEAEISSAMDRRNFLQHKHEVARIVIQEAETARQALMDVLTYPGGWLADSVDEEEYSNTKMEGCNEGEREDRSKELASLRSIYLPQVVFLLHSVLDQTAGWMVSFLKHAATFDKSLVADLVTDEPLNPAVWYRMAMTIADTVASEKNFRLYEELQTDNVTRLMTLLAETAVKLLRCTHYEASILSGSS
eukprot:scaffold58872_cov51-Attheya_sp.AAC.2